jgi:pSer/pThr/pTyr-binding forkhead associated (FHA) protein
LLREGILVVGRSTSCDIVVENPRVSRQHARLIVTSDGLAVSDLGSRAGVFVNGVRIAGVKPLCTGDLVAFAEVDFQISSDDAVVPANEDPDRTTLLDMEPLDVEPLDVEPLDVEPPSSRPRPIDRTPKTGQLDMLSTLVDKAIATERIDDISHVVTERLSQIAEACEAGRQVEDSAIVLACRLAVKLAVATDDGRWINAVIRIYRAQVDIMPVGLIDSLYGVMRHTRDVDWRLFAEYVDILEARRESLSPSERFRTSRIEGLLRSTQA